ncbi:MAG: hypothetical protein H6799_00765 [Candidatus Nomurabacteria bacterium]|nr:MAG: hypothetical protein H6799_00765 [Candidatus Nomurabacteria bacterium]
MTLADKQTHSRTKRRHKRAEKPTASSERRKTRKRERRDARRQSKMVEAGYTEERISATMDTRGEVTSVLQRQTREARREGANPKTRRQGIK